MSRDVLLDLDTAAGYLLADERGTTPAAAGVQRALAAGCRLWVSAADAEGLFAVLCRGAGACAGEPKDEARLLFARQRLAAFGRKVSWLAVLAADVQPEAATGMDVARLAAAVQRLGAGARVMSCLPALLDACPQALRPEDFVPAPDGDSPMPFIDMQAQMCRLLPAIEANIHRVLHRTSFILGPEVASLEEKLARAVGKRHAVSCASGTDALFMGLLAFDVRPGDIVFTTPFTFVATAEVISLAGAVPVFVDIDPVTYNMDPARLEQAIQAVLAADPQLHPLPRRLAANTAGRPRGIVPVDLFGLPADYDSIMAIARRHRLFVMEDGAQGFGGQYRGRPACGLADLGATSFFPAKPLGGYGDGGALFTDDDALAAELRSIRVHGQGRDKYDNVRIGINGRLDTLQAAVLLPKLAALAGEIDARQRAAERYDAGLADAASFFTTPAVPAHCRSAWAQYSVTCERRDAVCDFLRRQGVPTAVYYPVPLHLQTAYRDLGYGAGDFPVAERTAARIFSLPMHPYLGEEAQRRVTDALRKAAAG